MGLETVSLFYTDPKAVDDSWWGRQPEYKDPNQLELELKQFWPLTEQIPLEMSYEGCDTQPKFIRNEYPLGDGFAYSWGSITTSVSPVMPTLTVNAINSVGELSIGGINVALQKKPTWIQTQLHKLLGFNWRDK
jgi:hypothetical protein